MVNVILRGGAPATPGAMRKAHRPARPADEVQPRSGRRLCRRRI